MSDLFTPFTEDRITKLLASLNDGAKGREVFSLSDHVETRGLHILKAQNGKGEYWYNVLDSFGNCPTGFSANWRCFAHLFGELFEIQTP
jgi:hypothetical protein